MELFRLTCVTCHASLSVRDRAVIGKILSCPRCGSMVQVKAPDSWTAENPPAFSPQLSIPSSQSPITVPQSPVPSSQTPAPVSSPISQGGVSSETPARPGQGVMSGGLGPQAIVWGLAGTAAVGMLVGALAWSLGKWSVDSPATSSPASPALAAMDRQQDFASSLPDEAHVAVDSTAPPEGLVEAQIQSPDDQQGLDSLAETSTEPDADSPALGLFATGKAAADMLPPLPVGTETSAEPAESDSTEMDGVGAGLAGQQQLPRFDPLDLDPEGLDMASLGQTRTGRQPVFPDPTISPGEPGKSFVDDSLDGSSTVAGNPGERVADTQPGSPEELVDTQVVRLDPATVVPAVMPLAEEQLAMRLPAIEIDRMPLYFFLEMLSGLGNVPIQLGSEELRMAAISAAAPVSVRQQQTSLAEILHESLRPLHLDYRAVGPLVRIHWPGAEKPREIDYPISDLVTPETDIGRLAEWIRQLAAPTSWRVAGGEGDLRITGNTLHIHQSQRVQYQVLCFLERLRLVRKLKPRSRYPLERLSVEPALQQLTASLQGQARFTFSQYTPLSEIFSYWQQQLGLALLVDWPAVLGEPSAGLQGQSKVGQGALVGPATRVACAVAEQPWDQALDLVLEPLGLAWRAMDGQTLQITSAQIVQEEAQLEFYPLLPAESQGPGPPDLDHARVAVKMAELQKLVELPDSADQSRGPTALILDPVSHHLMALQPWSMHRRLWRRIDKAGAGR